MDSKSKFSKETKTPAINRKLYQRLVRRLLYTTINCLNIQFVVDRVLKYMNNLQLTYLIITKKILLYFKSILNHEIFYLSKDTKRLHTYTNIDWIRDIDTCKIRLGMLYKLRLVLIGWLSKLQLSIIFLLIKIEYYVLFKAAYDVTYFCKFFKELYLNNKDSISLLYNNVSSI